MAFAEALLCLVQILDSRYKAIVPDVPCKNMICRSDNGNSQMDHAHKCVIFVTSYFYAKHAIYKS